MEVIADSQFTVFEANRLQLDLVFRGERLDRDTVSLKATISKTFRQISSTEDTQRAALLEATDVSVELFGGDFTLAVDDQIEGVFWKNGLDIGAFAGNNILQNLLQTITHLIVLLKVVSHYLKEHAGHFAVERVIVNGDVQIRVGHVLRIQNRTNDNLNHVLHFWQHLHDRFGVNHVLRSVPGNPVHRQRVS
ncbi:hypothetical protein D3C71_983870 [compost metagenome]